MFKTMKKLIINLILFALFSVSMSAQTKSVTGTVRDANGEPIAGAVVFYEGASMMTTTDDKGHYVIRGDYDKTLVFSCFGFKDERVLFKGQDKINVVLKLEAMTLDDAVVIGYGEQQRADLTGSITSVKADEIRRSGNNNLLAGLQGAVAGLNITSQSGEPGAGFSISIRGNNSINASSAPLYVIDGIQMNTSDSGAAMSELSASSGDPLAFINPSDILSIEVLKDASATAIYGSQGANGVILITTKSGAGDSGKTSVTFDASVGVTTVARDIEMLDAQEWMNYRFLRTDYDGPLYFGYDSDGDGINDKPKTIAMTGETPTDWRKLMFRNAISQNYNLTLRTTIAKNTNILVAMGYLNQQGLILNNGYQKLTGRVKIGHKLGKKTSFGVNLNYARMQSDGAASSTGGSFNNNGLTQLIYIERPIAVVSPGEEAEYENGRNYSLYDMVTDETFSQGVQHKIMGSAYFQWDILKSLRFRAYASGHGSFSKQLEYYSSNSRWGYSANGIATRRDTETGGFNANMTLTYKKTWRKNHNFDAMLGVEMMYYSYDYFLMRGKDFDTDILGIWGLGSANILSAPTMSHFAQSRMSTFGRANYNYKQRYYVTFNMRADGSSKFAPGSRVGYFPSMSLAWRASKEDFMKVVSKKWLDNLKVRASVGSSGNDRIDDYAWMSTLGRVYYAEDGKSIVGYAPYSSANEDLKWETTYQYNVGLDLTMFKSRVDFTFDAFYKDTRDMLFKAALPSQSGFSKQWQNIGRVENKGLEFALKTVNVKRGDFMWTTNIAVDLIRNKILDLGDGISEMPNPNVHKGNFKDDPTKLMVGQPIGIIWGYEWDGNYQLDDFQVYYKGTKVEVDPSLVTSANYNSFDYKLKKGVTSMNGTSVMPGDRKYKDLSGDGVVKESEDKKILGSGIPDFSYGFGNTFAWRGLSLYVFFDGVYGREILNEFKAKSTPGSGNSTHAYNITRESFYNAWTPENGSNSYARIMNSINMQQPISSYYVEDGSYLRLKTIALSYNLPSKALKAMKMKGLSLNFTVNNVYVWTRYGGLDPDISSNQSSFRALDRLTYPKGRTYTLGITANF